MQITNIGLIVNGRDIYEHYLNYVDSEGVDCTDTLQCSIEMAVFICESLKKQVAEDVKSNNEKDDEQ